jgi:hypothetical protein
LAKRKTASKRTRLQAHESCIHVTLRPKCKTEKKTWGISEEKEKKRNIYIYGVSGNNVKSTFPIGASLSFLFFSFRSNSVYGNCNCCPLDFQRGYAVSISSNSIHSYTHYLTKSLFLNKAPIKQTLNPHDSDFCLK